MHNLDLVIISQMLIDVFQPLREMGAKIKVSVSNRLILAQAHQFEQASVLFAFCFCYVMWFYYICNKKRCYGPHFGRFI